ncbi:hypothetical protein, partial [Serratia marcescens]|uniref:hypothetical protein n=1 Tax=Serratia marcescens TaxID=615 RepID=UPI0011848E71
ATKRSSDEIFADEDILTQAANREGEFAYGKRAHIVQQGSKRKRYDVEEEESSKRMRTGDFITETLKRQAEEEIAQRPIRRAVKRRVVEEVDAGPRKRAYVALDTDNPTPALEAVTEQAIVPMNTGDEMVQATAQVLQTKRGRVTERSERAESNIPVEVPIAEGRRVRGALKVRPIKRVAPGIGVRTVDLEIPLRESVTNVSIPSEYERMETTVTRSVRRQPVRRTQKTYKPANSIIPAAVYHPSIQHHRALPKKERIIPVVRYHPSITMPRRY